MFSIIIKFVRQLSAFIKTEGLLIIKNKTNVGTISIK